MNSEISEKFRSLDYIFKHYGFSRSTIENMFKEGTLTKYQPKKLIFVDETEVEEFIRSGKVEKNETTATTVAA